MTGAEKRRTIKISAVLCARACAHAFVRACVRTCVRACVRVLEEYSTVEFNCNW